MIDIIAKHMLTSTRELVSSSIDPGPPLLAGMGLIVILLRVFPYLGLLLALTPILRADPDEDFNPDFPFRPHNVSGLASLYYRVGSYGLFPQALLIYSNRMSEDTTTQPRISNLLLSTAAQPVILLAKMWRERSSRMNSGRF